MLVGWEKSKNKILLADHCSYLFLPFECSLYTAVIIIVNEGGSLVLFLKRMLDKHLCGIHFARLLYKYLLFVYILKFQRTYN